MTFIENILESYHYAFIVLKNYCYMIFEEFSLERGWELKMWLSKSLAGSEINIASFEVNIVLCILGLIFITSMLYLVVAMLYNKLGLQSSDINVKLMSIVYEVHHISGNPNPPMEKMKRCIQLLNQCPSLTNHPMPPYNFTPFLRACWSGNTPLVRYMLQNNADIQSCLSTGETPFYLAAYRVTKNKVWDPSVINLLFSAGSIVHIICFGSSSLARRIVSTVPEEGIKSIIANRGV